MTETQAQTSDQGAKPWSGRDKPWALAALPNESGVALAARRNKAYFDWQIAGLPEFWRRMGLNLDVAGKTILDLGCGFGALSLDLAQRGAARVVGLDLDKDRIYFARDHISQAYPALADHIEFIYRDIETFVSSETTGAFDLVVSKDTFEHIQDLEGVVACARTLLKPGGRLAIGTSPLYYSPFGDHGEYFGRRLPWAGAIPEALLFPLARRATGKPLRSAADVGLNKMTPARFRSLFPSSAWRTDEIRYNVGDKVLMAAPALDALRKIPALEKYCTASIYCVLTKL
jgi:SAM-dependent methyltransferase